MQAQAGDATIGVRHPAVALPGRDGVWVRADSPSVATHSMADLPANELGRHSLRANPTVLVYGIC